MGYAKHEPSEKFTACEESVLLTNEVHLGVVGVKYLLFVNPLAQLMEGLLRGFEDDVHLEDCPNNYRKEGKHHIIEGDGPRKPKGPARSQIVKAVGQLNGGEDHVFIEEIEDHL